MLSRRATRRTWQRPPTRAPHWSLRQGRSHGTGCTTHTGRRKDQHVQWLLSFVSFLERDQPLEKNSRKAKREDHSRKSLLAAFDPTGQHSMMGKAAALTTISVSAISSTVYFAYRYVDAMQVKLTPQDSAEILQLTGLGPRLERIVPWNCTFFFRSAVFVPVQQLILLTRRVIKIFLYFLQKKIKSVMPRWVSAAVLAALLLVMLEQWQQEVQRQLVMEERRRRAEEQQRQQEVQRQLVMEERCCRAEEQQRQQEEQRQLAKEADAFIRTRRRFDTTQPLRYLCQLHLIENELRSRIEPRFDNWRGLLAAYEGINFTFSADRQSVRVMHLTPFQGESSHRVFGEFRCPCTKRWKSAGTWKDKWQQCQGCDAKVYPHVQYTLERSSNADREDEGEQERRPHDMSRCQKCREKGSLCMPRMYYAT
jgi:hypothetical protein